MTFLPGMARGLVGFIGGAAEEELPSLLAADDRNVSHGYSLRKLLPAYAGAAIRVRRSNDNAEQDIGFDGDGLLDTTALASFVSSNSAFVVTWYDQSGSDDLTSTSSGIQPRIVNAGTLDTRNSLPSILFNGAQSMSNLSVSWAVTSQSFFVAAQMTSGVADFARVISQSDSGDDYDNSGHYIPIIRSDTGAVFASYSDAGLRCVMGFSDNELTIMSSVHTGSAITNSENILTNPTPYTHSLNKTWTRFRLGAQLAVAPGGYLTGYISEALVYNNINKLSRISNIHSNMGAYWGLADFV